MNEYVTHAELIQVIEVLDALSIANMVIAIILYDVARSLLSRLVDCLNEKLHEKL